MADIELDNLDRQEEEEEQQQQQQQQQEAQQQTNIDNDDWRNESIVVIDTSKPDAIPNPRKDASAIRRAYTEDKKVYLGR